MQRRIEAQSGDVRFIRIRLQRARFIYGMGMSLANNMHRPRAAIGRAMIPTAR
ncbi:hypothetical protein [Mycobacterium avium]|uniref:hypothetical protein n=1 Tax=Mycobacterium avium TaxID=1764 RepID=UPI0015930025|nr:hypothetical protein [Mycobacterium avium]